ncbi:3-phenylpropionate/cinnamic acid dioxygenase subunit beta [soil metagenome]
MLRTSAGTYWEVYDFLMHEAELLDGHREREWVELCTDDVIYRMPVRETRERGAGDGFNDEMYYFDETRGSLELRVRRLETEYAWAEDPPSRTRHFVTNIRVAPGEARDDLAVRSNLLLYRSQGTELRHDLISAERRDVLRRTDEGLRLAGREILLDHSVLTTHNLSIFL